MQAPTMRLQEVNHHDAQHTSDMRVTLVESTDLSAQLRVVECDQGVLELLVHDLQQQPLVVQFASNNWVHPLKAESLLTVRRTEHAVQNSISMLAIVVDTLTTLLEHLHKGIPVVEQSLVDDAWVAVTAANPPACEAAGGRHVRARVRLPHTSRSWCNVLRRYLLSYTPTLAIEELTIRQNSSMYVDQVLAQRIGLIPVRYQEGATPPAHFDNNCFRFHCHVPLDAARTVTPFTTDQVQSTTQGVHLGFSQSAEVSFPIALLAPGQGIEAVGRVGIGVARTHAKHAACGQVGMHQEDTKLPTTQVQAHIVSYTLCGQLNSQVCIESAYRAMAQSFSGLRAGCVKAMQ